MKFINHEEKTMKNLLLVGASLTALLSTSAFAQCPSAADVEDALSRAPAHFVVGGSGSGSFMGSVTQDEHGDADAGDGKRSCMYVIHGTPGEPPRLQIFSRNAVAIAAHTVEGGMFSALSARTPVMEHPSLLGTVALESHEDAGNGEYSYMYRIDGIGGEPVKLQFTYTPPAGAAAGPAPK